MKKLISFIMVALMLISSLPMAGFAQAAGQPKLTIESADITPGETFDVNIDLENNPGIVSANLKVAFDEGLTLVGATNGDVFSTLTYIPPKQLSTAGRITSGCQFAWTGFDIADEDIKDGTILTLSFELSEEAEIGDTFAITVTSGNGDVVDKDLNAITLSAEGKITAIDYTPGDINDDTLINMMDIVVLSRYIVDGCKYDPDGYAVKINEKAANVNADSGINMLDVVLISRYIVDGCKTDPNGYNVTLLPSGKVCSHDLLATEAKDATCTEDGNIAYWQCIKCKKYFADANATAQIGLEDTTIESEGHVEVFVPAVPPTYDDYGYTEGSKCSVCGEYIKEPEPVEPLEKDEIHIEYSLRGNRGSDDYLKNAISQKIANGETINVNPSDVNTTEKSYTLRSIAEDAVPGYEFKGWYDGPGSDAKRIVSIPKGETGYLELFAHWSLVEYEVIFDSPDVPVENITFTVNKSVPLKNIELQGYTFVGWSVKDVVLNPVDGSVFSDNGKVITEIPVGTANDVVVHANWTSNRNLMRPVSKLDDPLFVEDMDNNQLIFVYKIGTVENVPLYTVADLPNSAGLTWEIESDVTKSIDTKTAQTISNTISNATTVTAGWTLSEDWNDVTTATEETGSENSKTQGRIDETGTVSGQQWYVSNSAGGAFTSSTSSGGSNSTSNKITDNSSWGLESASKTEVSASKTDTHQTELNASLSKTDKETFNWNVGANIGGSNEASVGANAGVEKKGVGSAGVSAGAKKTSNWGLSGGVGGSTEESRTATISGGIVDTHSSTVAAARSQGVTATINGSIGTESSSVSENHYDTNATASSNWNTTSGYETSETVSKNETVSKSISELVYNKYGISSSKSVGGSDVKTESTGRTSGSEDQYSSTVEYSTSEIKTLKQTLTNNGSGYGYYRVVQAATAHVFAVVGYDIATQSFYTTTHTIVDNESAKIFIDHSRKSSNFNDCENGVLEFEIPFDLYKFVSRVMMRSDGLKINYETGIVERYEGEGGNIVIPEYAANYNEATKKYSVTKVKGIASNAFANNDTITGVILPDYIEEIPEGAFANCTNLESLVSYGVTKIGKDAFKNCTSLKHYSVDRFVTVLGDNAFENVESIDVVAADKNVVEAAIKSGAKSISIDITYVEDALDNMKIEIGDIDLFRIVSDTAKEYNNLQIVSNAAETVIGNIVFKNNKDTPVKLSSEKVNLSGVTISGAPGFALVLTNDNTLVTVDGSNELYSNGENAVLSKNVTITEENGGSIGSVSLNGNYLIAGTLMESSLLAFEDGELIEITDEQFESYLTSSVITFDANGGSLAETTKTVYYGQLYGELPVPVRDHYSFLGWFTAVEGGTEVTYQTPVTALVNQTLYARWSVNAYKIKFDANGGEVSTSSKQVEYGSAYGELPVPIRTGWTFKGWFTAKNGGSQIKGDSIVDIDGEQTLYAAWEVNGYTATWSNVANGTITVERTSSPNKGAAIGKISSGAAVYYGDVLSITYTASAGYSVSDKGYTSITVTRNITGSDIRLTVSPNSYTYNIVYKSVNNKNLGSTTVTYKFGTTNTISAPWKDGYNTPSSQSIKWDSTSPKTITFTYGVTTVGPTSKSGTIYTAGASKLTYSATVEHRNRTANSVQIRVNWTSSLSGSGAYNQYGQWFRANVGGASTGNVNVAPQGTWSAASSATRSKSASSGWITVPLSTTNKTSVSLSVYYYQANYNGTDMSYNGASNLSATWSIALPAY